MRHLYSLLWRLLLPALFLRLWWRGRQAPAYRLRWRERLACYGGQQRLPACVWVHAVSVGETLAAAPMIEQLLQHYPDTRLLVTTMTPTGSERVRALFGERVTHVYAPWELPGAVRRFYNAFNPQLVLLLETELWPNLIHEAARRRVPVMLLNGRLSARSARGYARLPKLVKPMLAALDCLAVQTSADGERFIELGARPDQVQVTGSVKFDVQLSDAQQQLAQAWRAQQARPVWIAASTHAGEDEKILAAHRQVCVQHPQALLILVPRHPERFNEVAKLVQQQGFTLARRSETTQPQASTQVYLGDTMGELMQLYGFADVAWVGGSFVETGGHNLLEPALWGAPVLSGPSLFNFALISELLSEAGGLKIVSSAEQLGNEVSALLASPATQKQMGSAAQQVVAAHGGALQRVLSLLSARWPSTS